MNSVSLIRREVRGECERCGESPVNLYSVEIESQREVDARIYEWEEEGRPGTCPQLEKVTHELCPRCTKADQYMQGYQKLGVPQS